MVVVGGGNRMGQLQCPSCGRRLRVPVAASGRLGRCACGHIFPIKEDRVTKAKPWLRMHGVGVLEVIGILVSVFFWLAGSVCANRAQELRPTRDGEWMFNAALGCWVIAVIVWLMTMMLVAWKNRGWRRGAAYGAALGGVLVLPVSQYIPLVGGWVAAIAMPWSPARLSYVGIHFLLLVLVCGVVGALLANRD